MDNYIQPGEKITWTNDTSSDYSAGDMVAIADRVGVCEGDIDAGSNGVLLLEGVVEYAKAAADDMSAVGTAVYFDATADEITLAASGNTPAGFVTEPAAALATEVRVKLNA